MERLPPSPEAKKSPNIRLVAVAQVAWITFLALPTLAMLGYSLWPRPGAAVRLAGIHVTGGPIVLAAGVIIALAPTIWYLAVLLITRAR